MPVDIGRISGIMLRENLLRQGEDLRFENNLIHLDVNTHASNPLLVDGTGLVGIKTNNPTADFDVVGRTRSTNLKIDTSFSNSDITLDTNRITTALGSLNLTAANYVFSPSSKTDNIEINNNVISTYTSNTNLEIRPTGTLEVHANTNITGSLYATGDITLDGNITFGSDTSDSVTFNSDLRSDLVPDQTDTYNLGEDPLTGKRWNQTRTRYVNGRLLETTALSIPDGTNLALRPGNSWFVAKGGKNTNQGNHENSPFLTIAQALSVAQAGDEVFVYPGTYEEPLPLVIPAGVHVRGANIRLTMIKPDINSWGKNVFELDGQSTVSDLTVRDFFYDSVNDTGYAFSFVNGALISERSPYIQNVSVITVGSSAADRITSILDGEQSDSLMTSIADGGTAFTAIFSSISEGIGAAENTSFDPLDPLGFNDGDAGRGAKVDGALVDPASPQASMLFHSVTMIVPNADALTMTNGVRVEWLNSFTYFANRGLYATNGITGFNGKFGAEIRSIGSANVYGNYGAVADGNETLMYLINYNFGYIGCGKDATNDSTLVIQANETVELNSGRIYYQSQDQGGTFRVGDSFFVDFATGNTSFDTSGLDITGATSLTIKNGVHETVINSTYLKTGNYRISGNLVETLTGAVNVSAASGITNLTLDVNVSKNLDVTGDFALGGELILGNQTSDTITFETPLDQDLNPDINLTYDLGSPSIVWKDTYLKEANIDDVTIRSNILESSTTNVSLQLTANGTGIVNMQESVTADQNFSVNGLSTVKAVGITGTVTHIGNVTQTGDRELTGNLEISNNLRIDTDAIFPAVSIVNNVISTTTTNTDLVLEANGTGIINTLASNVRIDNDLTVDGVTEVASVTVINRTTADEFYTNTDVLIYDNIVTTTATNSNLELYANGTGGVFLETSKLTSNTLSSTDNVVFVPATGKQFIVDTTGSIKVPAGTNLDRPTKARGDLRFNTSDSTFEGFDGSASRGFGAVYSADRLTSVKATKTSNILQFTANSVLTMDITSARVRLNGLYVDNIQMDGSTTQAINSDLTFSPNGTGLNIVEQVTFDGENLQNDNTSTPLTFAATNRGYLRLTGSNGFVIPYGDDASRPAIPEVGDTRYNTQQGYIEVWDGTQYNSAAGVGESVTADFMREETDLWSLILG